jgi:hypothetical protein
MKTSEPNKIITPDYLEELRRFVESTKAGNCVNLHVPHIALPLLLDEVTRLRDLVEKAWREGFQDGLYDWNINDSLVSEDDYWGKSRAKRAATSADAPVSVSSEPNESEPVEPSEAEKEAFGFVDDGKGGSW